MIHGKNRDPKLTRYIQRKKRGGGKVGVKIEDLNAEWKEKFGG